MRRSPGYIIIAATCALGLSGSDLQAQLIGFKLGASMSTLDVSDAGNTSIDSNTGFAGGGFIRFGDRIGIQVEVLSVTKGAEVDAAGDDDQDFKFEYVELPLHIHVPLTAGASFAPYVFGGPSVALEVGCEVSSPGGTELDCDDDNADIFDRKKTDFGVGAGAGFAFLMGPGAVLVEGRYTWGLSNMNETEGGPELKNRSALFLVGYAIQLGSR